METFSALLAICAGNSPVPVEFPTQRPVTRCFDVFFDLLLNKRLSKQSWGWWLETLSRLLWRRRNDFVRPSRCSPWWILTKFTKIIPPFYTHTFSGPPENLILDNSIHEILMFKMKYAIFAKIVFDCLSRSYRKCLKSTIVPHAIHMGNVLPRVTYR